MGVNRMNHTPFLPMLFFWLIQRVQKHDKKCHVIGERHFSQDSMADPQAAAQPAVTGAVAVKLLFSHGIPMGEDISKHDRLLNFYLLRYAM